MNKGETMEKKKSIGITLTGVVFLALDILITPVCMLMLMGLQAASSKNALMFLLVYIIITGIPIISLFSGIGLLLLKKWSRICAIVTATAMSLVFSGYGISALLDKKANAMNTFLFKFIFYSVCSIGALSFALIIFYLTRPKVKEQFNRPKSGVQ